MNTFRILNAIKRSEQRIQEAIDSGEECEEIQKIEREHIDNLRDLLAEPMSANILEESFN